MVLDWAVEKKKDVFVYDFDSYGSNKPRARFVALSSAKLTFFHVCAIYSIIFSVK